MDSCTDKCFVDKNEDEVNPLFLSDSNYYRRCPGDDKNDRPDPLTVWSLKKCHSVDVYNTVFDMDLSAPQTTNTGLGDKCTDFGQCVCINAWTQLKQIFELTDAELEKTYSIKYSYPEDEFCGMPINSENDGCGKSLEDFKLDGEYLFADSDGITSNDLNGGTKTSTKDVGDTAATDELEPEQKGPPVRVGRPDNNAAGSANDKKKTAKNSGGAKTGDVAEINKNHHGKTALVGHRDDDNAKLGDRKHARSANEKPYGRRKTAFERPPVCCSAYGSDADNKQVEKENNMKYLYTFGEEYRGGIRCGHKDCIDCVIRVPRHKGWVSSAYVIRVRHQKCLIKRVHTYGCLQFKNSPKNCFNTS